MLLPLKKQTLPEESGAASVLIEGRPAVVLSGRSNDKIPMALPTILIEGKPVTVLSVDSRGAATILGSTILKNAALEKTASSD